MTADKDELARVYREWIEAARTRGGMVRAAFAREVRAEVRTRLPAEGDPAAEMLRESYFPTDGRGRRDVLRQKARESAKYTSWTRAHPGPSVPSHPIEREALAVVVHRYAPTAPPGSGASGSFRALLEELAALRAEAAVEQGRIQQEAARRRRAEKLAAMLEEPEAAAGPEAMYRLGVLAQERGKRGAAARWLERAAREGHAGAMLRLGAIADERGDQATAKAWWERAAKLDGARGGHDVVSDRVDADELTG
ncbi:tol-pal system YbgF family protein [Agromyces sp. MMS24-JH15]|uniref:tetratricopeptide repeat protein n=1 Tax=Agromyces sp. MMS24-JH15 TaxID=3243765 RepID=UPI003749D4A0